MTWSTVRCRRFRAPRNARSSARSRPACRPDRPHPPASTPSDCRAPVRAQCPCPPPSHRHRWRCGGTGRTHFDATHCTCRPASADSRAVCAAWPPADGTATDPSGSDRPTGDCHQRPQPAPARRLAEHCAFHWPHCDWHYCPNCWPVRFSALPVHWPTGPTGRQWHGHRRRCPAGGWRSPPVRRSLCCSV